MSDWSPGAYLAFAEERLQPARDLLARVDLVAPQLVHDLGCGPGNSTALLRQRWPAARIVGFDRSPSMLADASRTVPDADFVERRIESYQPTPDIGLVYANASLRWLDDPLAECRRLLAAMTPGAVLAVQMPDNVNEPSHREMENAAAEMAFAERIAGRSRHALPPVRAFHDTLAPLSSHLHLWSTVYTHAVAGPGAIVDFVASTGLRPFLDPLDRAEREVFLRRYRERIDAAYPATADGLRLLFYPRRFIVARRA